MFFYPYVPLMPPLAGRVSLTPFNIFVPGYTTLGQYVEAYLEVVRDADWVVVDVPTTNPRLLRNVSPGRKERGPAGEAGA